MRTLFCMIALCLAASVASAGSGVLLPGQDISFGNLHVANLPGAGGNVNYVDNGTRLFLVVHDDAYCAVLKRGAERPSRAISTLVLGGGYYAQANVSGAYLAVLGDNAVALSLALRRRHKNNANTMDVLGNDNIVATARWCYGRGQVVRNRIRFGRGPAFPATGNDAYIGGDTKATRKLAWANRTRNRNGHANTTIAWDGLACRPESDVAAADESVADVARDVATLDSGE